MIISYNENTNNLKGLIFKKNYVIKIFLNNFLLS